MISVLQVHSVAEGDSKRASGGRHVCVCLSESKKKRCFRIKLKGHLAVGDGVMILVLEVGGWRLVFQTGFYAFLSFWVLNIYKNQKNHRPCEQRLCPFLDMLKFCKFFFFFLLFFHSMFSWNSLCDHRTVCSVSFRQIWIILSKKKNLHFFGSHFRACPDFAFICSFSCSAIIKQSNQWASGKSDYF